MSTWLNSDGLYVRNGRNEVVPVDGGEFPSSGAFRSVFLDIPVTPLTTTEAIQFEGILLNAGTRITSVTVITETAVTSGGSATLDVGLIKTDRSSALDDDGLIAALAIASFNAAGETVTLTPGVTSAGALIGTTLAFDGYVTASYNTAAFTAGVIRVIVEFYVP